MLSAFFRNAVLVLVLNLTVKGVYLFVIERTVQNVLPEGDYGLYFSFLGIGLILQVVADFGLQHYSSRTISGHRQLLTKYFPYFLGLKLILGGLYFAAVLLAGFILGYGSGQIGLLLLVGAGQFLNSLVIYLRSNLAGLGKYALDSTFSILDKLLMIALIGGLLGYRPDLLNIEVFAGTQVLCWLVTATTITWVLRDKLVGLRPRFRREKLLLLLRGGAPFALAILLQAAYTRTDAVMIERLLRDGAEAAGHYAAGYRLLDALNTVGWLTAGLLLPMYARLHARGERLTDLLRLSTQLLVGGAAVVSIALAAYAAPVVQLLYDFAEPRTASILFFLSLTFTAQCLSYVYGALLAGTGYIGRMNYVFVAGIMVNVAGNYWAIPRYGAPGAAAMTLLTQSFIAVLQAGLAHRWLEMAGDSVRWVRLGILAGLLPVVVVTVASLGDGWVWQLGLSLVLGAALLPLLGLLNPSELTLLLRDREGYRP
ncbi:O-antigen/teichoic acid export membrane protein [Neolewinella xylanilytica]|uniref:O-antigen/teichoic acid export membrane protein n=1 Tax=Neolewinella xylanilytica TaxID=1514080 RepID=A0A2S6I219_9BACT|nr:polysaccharide biosynthesis C-terminal domain-containing protein [Neolewinella xylanilytica]PPK85214.1 O-antigen/teichoic acid export membrane protein [Neolewinella xylanilytica]